MEFGASAPGEVSSWTATRRWMLALELELHLENRPGQESVRPVREADARPDLNGHFVREGEPELRKESRGVHGGLPLEFRAHAHESLGRIADSQGIREGEVPVRERGGEIKV